MIIRDAAVRLRDLARFYPVVSVTGPRQSGKTTLCRATFPDLPYVSLEPLDVREFGDWRTTTLPDRWTAVTIDGSLSAQFEHTVTVTETGVEVLTLVEGRTLDLAVR